MFDQLAVGSQCNLLQIYTAYNMHWGVFSSLRADNLTNKEHTSTDYDAALSLSSAITQLSHYGSGTIETLVAGLDHSLNIR